MEVLIVSRPIESSFNILNHYFYIDVTNRNEIHPGLKGTEIKTWNCVVDGCVEQKLLYCETCLKSLYHNYSLKLFPLYNCETATMNISMQLIVALMVFLIKFRCVFIILFIIVLVFQIIRPKKFICKHLLEQI